MRDEGDESAGPERAGPGWAVTGAGADGQRSSTGGWESWIRAAGGPGGAGAGGDHPHAGEEGAASPSEAAGFDRDAAGVRWRDHPADNPADDLAALFAGPPAEMQADLGAPGERETGRRRGRTVTVVAMAALAVALVASAGATLLRPEDTVVDGPAAEGGAPGPPSPSAPAHPPPGTASPRRASAADPADAADSRKHGGPLPARAQPNVPGNDTTLAPLLAVRAVHAVRTAETAAPRHVLDATAVDHVALPQSTVVTVEAVVVDGPDGVWQAPRPARYGVALDTAEAVALAPPWPLPPPTPAPAQLRWEDISGDAQAADQVREALADAGFTDLPKDDGAVRLSRSADVSGVLQAQLRATAPGDPQPAEHILWLHDERPPTLLGAEGDRP